MKKDPAKSTYVALLRGINVGGRNLLPMKELAAIFEGAGCADVRTYIQSGNVVFAATPSAAQQVQAEVARVIAERFEFRVPIILRSAQELAKAARENPFVRAKTDLEALHVAFLSDAPRPGSIALLEAKRSAPDEFVVKGREIYLRLTNGVARTKLTNDTFDRTLATTSTMRNWRTVLKLVELVELA